MKDLTFSDLEDNFELVPIANTMAKSMAIPKSILDAESERQGTKSGMYREPCESCGGTGKWRGTRECFKCKGVGHRDFAMSKEKREKARVSANDRIQKKISTFSDQYPDLWQYLVEAAEAGYDMAIFYKAHVRKKGMLSEKQIAAVRRWMGRNAGLPAKLV